MPQLHPASHISKNLLSIIDLLNTNIVSIPISKINFYFGQAEECAALVGSANIPVDMVAAITSLCDQIDFAFLRLGVTTLKTDELTDFVTSVDEVVEVQSLA
jgi:hypothetical protein